MKTTVFVMLLLAISLPLFGRQKSTHPDSAHRSVPPTWLHRYVPKVPAKKVDISASGCRYRPIFGAGDSEASIVQSVARYGEVALDPKAACKEVSYSSEEQVYFIMDGSGLLDYAGRSIRLTKDDFIYIPPGV